MSNRYQEDLKRIVGISEEQGTTKQHAPKKPIKGGRGIVYFDAKGKSKVAEGNPPEPDEDDEDDENEDATIPPDNGAGGGGNGFDESGIPPPVVDGYDETVRKFRDMKEGDYTSGIDDLVDCDTGDCVSVRYDGNFTSPEGWDTPENSPIPDGYFDGAYWSDSMNNSLSRQSSASAFFLYVGQQLADSLISIGQTIIDIWYDEPIYYFETPPFNARTNVYVSYRRDTDPPGYVAVNTQYNVIAYRRICSVTYDAICDVLPYETDWPEDKCTEVSYNSETGKFETHPNDTKVPSKLAGGISNLPALCTSGGDHISHWQQANGEIAVFNETTGVAKFINSRGVVVGYGGAAAITEGQPR